MNTYKPSCFGVPSVPSGNVILPAPSICRVSWKQKEEITYLAVVEFTLVLHSISSREHTVTTELASSKLSLVLALCVRETTYHVMDAHLVGEGQSTETGTETILKLSSVCGAVSESELVR